MGGGGWGGGMEGNPGMLLGLRNVDCTTTSWLRVGTKRMFIAGTTHQYWW